MKRGISPIVSYVLIVVLSVSIGFLVINTLIDRIEDVDIGPEIEYCDEVEIEVDGVCKTPMGIISINLSSTEAFSVHKFSFGRVTDIASLQWCDYTVSPLPLDFGEEEIYGLSLNDNYVVAVDEPTRECMSPTSSGIPTTGLVELRIVPWIKPEGELISCKNKEVIIKENINGGC